MDFQISVHAVGDKAIDISLDAFEEALRVYPKEDHRHRIEHFELPSARAIRRMSDMNMIASMVPNAAEKWSAPGAAYDVRLGKDRVKKNNPFAKIMQAGVKIAAGSDSDITDMSPFVGIHALVNSSEALRKTSLLEALRLYTINGAYAVFEDHIKGSLEKGKNADFLVIDKNPFEIEGSEICSIGVLLTVKMGMPVYQRGVMR